MVVVVKARWRWLVLAIGVIVLALSGWRMVSVQGHGTKVTVASARTPAPSVAAARPPQSGNWLPDEPKQIIIPAISAQAFIHPLGVDPSGQMAAPADIAIVGWYDRSVRPGARGLSIINGHVDGPSGTPGAFSNLAKLHMGDQFVVTLGNNSQLHYQVTGSQSLPVAAVPAALFSQDPRVSRQLNLVTCSGPYNTQTGQYANRIIITARQL